MFKTITVGLQLIITFANFSHMEWVLYVATVKAIQIAQCGR